MGWSPARRRSWRARQSGQGGRAGTGAESPPIVMVGLLAIGCSGAELHSRESRILEGAGEVNGDRRDSIPRMFRTVDSARAVDVGSAAAARAKAADGLKGRIGRIEAGSGCIGRL